MARKNKLYEPPTLAFELLGDNEVILSSGEVIVNGNAWDDGIDPWWYPESTQE